jgi:predicted nucleotidyltransferase
MPFTVAAERPVDQITREILRHAAKATQTVRITYFVGGALARDLLLYHVFGMPRARLTHDVDLMAFVEDWTAFEKLKATLLATGRFSPDPRAAHRLLYSAEGAKLDIVPFGGVESPPGKVAWPPTGEVVMAVVGFREAARTVIPVAVETGLVVPVVALAALAMLKLTAWADRHQETTKDAVDLLILLRSYASADNLDRLYGEELDLLRGCEFDPEPAGARLLARDAVRLCGADLARAVLSRFTSVDRELLTQQMLQQAIQFDDEGLQSRVAALQRGFWDEMRIAAAVG